MVVEGLVILGGKGLYECEVGLVVVGLVLEVGFGLGIEKRLEWWVVCKLVKDVREGFVGG